MPRKKKGWRSMAYRRRVARRLKEWREVMEFSQEDLAGEVGCHRQLVSRWERGRSMPGPEMLASIADALDVDTVETLISAGPE